jgi:UDP-glucuronate decarboxylase
MPTSLVTGGAGFLGSHLCDELLGRGHRVICVDNFETGSLRNIEHIRVPEFTHLHLDIIKPFFVDEPVDFVYHLASPASPIDYLRLPLHTLKVGSHGTHHALGLAKQHRARFLVASTSEVYGDPQVHPQPETYWGHVNPIGPRGVYDEAKRYAEALTMAYHRQQGVDTAIIRIFNSILADEQVLYDDGRELRRETAAALAQRLCTRALAAGYVPAFTPAGGILSTEITPGFEYPTDGFSVPSFGEGGRMQAAEPLAFVGHPTNERCYEIRTRYGRSIKVTGGHSVFVEGEDGEPVEKAAEDLVPGEDRIAVIRRLEVPERDRTQVSVLEAWREAELDPWDLLVEAPGLGDQAWQHRAGLFALLEAERKPGSRHWRNGIWTRIIRMRQTGRVPLPCLSWMGSTVPEGARIRPARGNASLPARITVTDELLWFLGLWVAEGSWHESPGNSFITLSCDEDRVARAADIVERTLGLHVVRAAGSDARSAAMFVHSKLLLRVMEHLGFSGARKNVPGWILGMPLGRLKWFLEGYREGDGVHSGRHFDEAIRHEFSTTSTDLKDDLIVAFARFGLVPSIGRYRSRIGAREGSVYPFWRLTLCNVAPWSMLEWDEGVTQRLNARVTGDLVWAAVTAVGEVAATELVYDFSVPGLENFWAGSGIAAKNTYGARMRPHDGRAIPTFLRQALQDRPITVFGDGSQTRSFCYVDDLIRGMIALAESGHHQPVNVGNPNEFTLLELAETILGITGSKSEIIYEALPTDDPQVRQPDITKAREILGWEPEVQLRDGLQRTIEQAGVEALVGTTT